MIEVQEIRAGNVFHQIEWGRIAKVRAVILDPEDDPDHADIMLENNSGNREAYFPDDLAPITLLPDLVEKLGFRRCVHLDSDGSKITGWKGGENDRFLLVRDETIWHLEDVSGERPRIINMGLSHIHELQNLYFALTGEELAFDS